MTATKPKAMPAQKFGRPRTEDTPQPVKQGPVAQW